MSPAEAAVMQRCLHRLRGRPAPPWTDVADRHRRHWAVAQRRVDIRLANGVKELRETVESARVNTVVTRTEERKVCDARSSSIRTVVRYGTDPTLPPLLMCNGIGAALETAEVVDGRLDCGTRTVLRGDTEGDRDEPVGVAMFSGPFVEIGRLVSSLSALARHSVDITSHPTARAGLGRR